ncbi:TonB-dependent receptor [Parasphingorhabdus sp.]|uniref:TonB-dependent receptor n=1 Tax=Parasphingorhabdus sp. TaxID=2709688 RepID=UPI0032EFDAA0
MTSNVYKAGRAIGAVSTLAIAVSAFPASAQDSNASAETEADESVIIVTANKRPQVLRETPGTINVVSADTIREQGLNTVEDILRLTPGANYQKTEPNDSVVTIRGIGTSTVIEQNQSTTGVYIGDVPISDATVPVGISAPVPIDLEAVEVLKGPQGVLYGSASLSGAIRYQFARPDFSQELGGEVSASLSVVEGGDLGYGGHGVLNVTSESGGLGARVIGFYRLDGGYIDNVGAGVQNSNDFEQFGGRLVLEGRPSSDVTIVGYLHYEESSADDSFAVNAPVDALEATNRLVTNNTDRSFLFGNVVVDWDIGPATITSSTGYNRKEAVAAEGFTSFANLLLFSNQFPLLDGDPTNDFLNNPAFPASVPVALQLNDSRSEGISQELRIASNPGDGPFSWLVGGFYQAYDSRLEGDLVASGVSGVPPITEVKIAAETEEFAVFVDAEYKLTDRLSVAVGVRYYDNSADGIASALVLGAGAPLPIDISDDGFAPRAAITYDISDDVTSYVRYSRGFRFGGANIVPQNPAFPSPSQYGSDTLDAYEAGFKADFDSGLYGEITGYYYDWQDAQATVVRPDSFVFVDNVGQARVIGLEAIAGYRSRSFDFVTSLNYNESETRNDFVGALGPVPAGTELPGTPEFQTFTAVTYRAPAFADGEWSVTLSHSYISHYFESLDQTIDLGGYHQINAAVGLTLSAGLELRLIANNLTDDTTATGAVAFPTIGFQNLFVNTPRNYALSVRKRF